MCSGLFSVPVVPTNRINKENLLQRGLWGTRNLSFGARPTHKGFLGLIKINVKSLLSPTRNRFRLKDVVRKLDKPDGRDFKEFSLGELKVGETAAPLNVLIATTAALNDPTRGT